MSVCWQVKVTCVEVCTLFTFCCVMRFSFWGYIKSLSFGNRLHPSACYRHAWNCVCSIILIWLQNYSHGAQALREQEWTQWLGLGLSVFLIGLCEYLDWPKSLVLCLSWKVLFFSFPQYKGIIIPIYFCVLQSWHPETRHGDKTWTAGPRKSCSLFCHHHLLFNPFLCNAHLFFQYTMIYIYVYK